MPFRYPMGRRGREIYLLLKVFRSISVPGIFLSFQAKIIFTQSLSYSLQLGDKFQHHIATSLGACQSPRINVFKGDWLQQALLKQFKDFKTEIDCFSPTRTCHNVLTGMGRQPCGWLRMSVDAVRSWPSLMLEASSFVFFPIPSFSGFRQKKCFVQILWSVYAQWCIFGDLGILRANRSDTMALSAENRGGLNQRCPPGRIISLGMRTEPGPEPRASPRAGRTLLSPVPQRRLRPIRIRRRRWDDRRSDHASSGQAESLRKRRASGKFF